MPHLPHAACHSISEHIFASSPFTVTNSVLVRFDRFSMLCKDAPHADRTRSGFQAVGCPMRKHFVVYV